jgi:hypothetical protein
VTLPPAQNAVGPFAVMVGVEAVVAFTFVAALVAVQPLASVTATV